MDNIANNSWENVKMIAHKIKSSYNTIGAKETGEILEKIELETAFENKGNIQSFVAQLGELSERVFREVRLTIGAYGE